jgi:hypothetical protein
MENNKFFSKKLLLDCLTECLNWQGALDKDGYGGTTHQGKRGQVHRIAYELINGPIPKGMTIDHLCRNRRCCNPEHLEAVTIKTNTMRGTSFSAKNAKKTHCINGHLLDEKNTYIRTKERGRSCRTCNSSAVKKYKQRAA